jgi:alpha-amylase/alpha-mannosidase (GH57 family)
VNFSPVLLEQIGEYAAEVNGWLRKGTAIKDPVLNLLTPGGVPQEPAQRAVAIRMCLKANRERSIERFEAFRELAAMAEQFLRPDTIQYAAAQFLIDLAVWYHLAWVGETVRLGDPRVQELMTRGRDFSAEDCRQLLEVVGEILAGIIPRYRRLMGSGQVELSVTPYGHPIIPLLLDFRTAREALPTVPLPADPEYPGGDDRASWHIARAIQIFTETFGVRPRGCWPAEGGVSARTLAMLDSFGFDWAATGEGVLRNSGGAPAHQPCRLPHQDIRCFFRDDGLSDLIGFTYAKWHGDDAAANLLQHLLNIADALEPQEERVVSIILDGENAWEYYPFNAYFFLKAMYEKLSTHPRLRLTTFSQCLAEGIATAQLPHLVAGSWVYGNFSTWVGHAAKNRAWEMLCEAKRIYDQVVVEGALSEEQQRAAERQLGICEGSDWFWWFGDDNPAEAVANFDALYRRHLTNLYRFLAEEPPAYLAVPFTHGHGSPELGGVMKRTSPLPPEEG